MKFYLLFSIILFSLASAATPCSQLLLPLDMQSPGREEKIKNNQIFVDGVSQPQMYGAEFQYFRLRGAYGRNVPRSKVIETWRKGLSNMRKAGMNLISFYIPWDFHEYAPGKFDFTGTVDEDGNGMADQ